MAALRLPIVNANLLEISLSDVMLGTVPASRAARLERWNAEDPIWPDFFWSQSRVAVLDWALRVTLGSSAWLLRQASSLGELTVQAPVSFVTQRLFLALSGTPILGHFVRALAAPFDLPSLSLPEAASPSPVVLPTVFRASLSLGTLASRESDLVSRGSAVGLSGSATSWLHRPALHAVLHSSAGTEQLVASHIHAVLVRLWVFEADENALVGRLVEEAGEPRPRGREERSRFGEHLRGRFTDYADRLAAALLEAWSPDSSSELPLVVALPDEGWRVMDEHEE